MAKAKSSVGAKPKIVSRTCNLCHVQSNAGDWVKGVCPSCGKAESKEQRFTRLAQPRMRAALKQLQGIERLFSSNYRWTEQQGEKIMSTLQAALVRIEAGRSGSVNDESVFSL